VTRLELRSQTTQTVYLRVAGDTPEAQTYELSIERNPRQALCEDDSFEENDHPADASILPTDAGAILEVSLKLCGDDPDWFVLPDLLATQGLEIGRAEADSQVAIDVYTPDGRRFELAPQSSHSSGAFS